jgi:mandelate racemase
VTELTVRDVTVRSVVVPLRRPLATKVGDFSRWPLLLIDVTTGQGITGRGYLAPYLSRAAAALRTVLEDMGAALRGQPVSPAAAYASARGWLGLAGYQGLALAAVAGLDIALWDALAQAAGLPLAVLLGGTLAPVPAYNSNGLGLIPPERVADEALELLAEGGFTALKVRVGRDRTADDLAVVRRVRTAVGDDMTLVADYNQGLSLGEALDRCRALDAEGLSWIEEPRPPAPARRPRQRPGMGRGRRSALPGLVLFLDGPDDRPQQGRELVLLATGEAGADLGLAPVERGEQPLDHVLALGL